MDMNGQLHDPITLRPGKEPVTLIIYQAGWSPELVAKRKISALPGIKTQSFSR
jgi:hypothetical protein